MMVETELSSESADYKISRVLGETVSLNAQISWQHCFEMTSQSNSPLKIDPSVSSAHGSSANDSGQSANKKPPGSSADLNDDPGVLIVWLRWGGQSAHVKVQQGGKTERWMTWENLWQSWALKWNQSHYFFFSLMLCFQDFFFYLFLSSKF